MLYTKKLKEQKFNGYINDSLIWNLNIKLLKLEGLTQHIYKCYYLKTIKKWMLYTERLKEQKFEGFSHINYIYKTS